MEGRIWFHPLCFSPPTTQCKHSLVNCALCCRCNPPGCHWENWPQWKRERPQSPGKKHLQQRPHRDPSLSRLGQRQHAARPANRGLRPGCRVVLHQGWGESAGWSVWLWEGVCHRFLWLYVMQNWSVKFWISKYSLIYDVALKLWAKIKK